MYFSLKWRLLFWVLGVGLFVVVFLLGAYLPITEEQGNTIRQLLLQKNENLDEFGIFANNVIPSLEMFVPGVGVFLGGYAAFSTGQVYAAFALGNVALKSISPLSLLAAPFAIMEIFAYAVAISRSGILTYFLIKRNWKNSWKQYIIPTIIEIGIVVLILFIGSLIEWQTIISRRT